MDQHQTGQSNPTADHPFPTTDSTTDQKLSLRLLRPHQIILATGLATSLLAIGIYVWLNFGLPTNIVDIDARRQQSASFQVDINVAQLGELVLLPGIGIKLAEDIVSFRNSEGPFESHESLLKITGLGTKKLASLKRYLLPISTNPSSPPPAKADYFLRSPIKSLGKSGSTIP